MGPTEGRDVRQEVWRTVHAFAAAIGDGLSEMFCVPVNDDRGQQVQASHAEVLAYCRTIADFTLAVDAESVLQGMAGLAFVPADLGAALHVTVRSSA